MSAKPEPKSTPEKTVKAAAAAPGVSPATISPGADAKDSVYDSVAKELATLATSDAQVKKIGSSPLGETRGQDVLRLHATLKGIDLLNGKVNRVFASLQTALADLDSHLHTDATSLTGQGDRQSSSILKAVAAAQADLNDAVSTAQSTLTAAVSKAQSSLSDQLTKSTASLTKTVDSAQSALSEQLSKSTSSITKTVKDAQAALSEQVAEAQTALSGEVAESLSDLSGRSDNLLNTMKDSFSKVLKATAGSEENLKSQTSSFSSAVEELLSNVQNTLQKQIFEFREETTRQVDKRMNQADVAFAAVRADQEVIKALLTDIIKDRMGRAEPKYR